MNFEELIIKNRSYRRFNPTKPVSDETLRYLVDIARRTPSAGNRQPLKYILISDPARCGVLFPFLRWAGALKGWGGPDPGERPVAYIIILCDKDIAADAGCDHGIAAQSMLLAAAERGLGGCMLGAIDRDAIRKAFAIPDRYEILLVVSLGVPAETCVLEDAKPGGDVTYYRDSRSVHHVPKRPLEEIILAL
jgi:nitroreductase